MHFITFNIVVIDAAFIGTRTLLHSQLIRAIIYQAVTAFAVLFLCLVDIMEIIWVTYKVVYLKDDQIIPRKNCKSRKGEQIKETAKKATVIPQAKNNNGEAERVNPIGQDIDKSFNK